MELGVGCDNWEFRGFFGGVIWEIGRIGGIIGGWGIGGGGGGVLIIMPPCRLSSFGRPSSPGFAGWLLSSAGLLLSKIVVFGGGERIFVQLSTRLGGCGATHSSSPQLAASRGYFLLDFLAGEDSSVTTPPSLYILLS